MWVCKNIGFTSVYFVAAARSNVQWNTQNEKCLSAIKKTYLLTKFLSVQMYCLKAKILLKTSRCCVRFTLLIRSSNALWGYLFMHTFYLKYKF